METSLVIQPEAVYQEQQARRITSAAKVSKSVLTDAKRNEIKKVSKDFESLFIGMMLKSMRATVTEDKLTGGGKGEENFRFLLDQEYANAASKSGGVGIAKIVEKELLRRYAVQEPSQLQANTAVVEAKK